MKALWMAAGGALFSAEYHAGLKTRMKHESKVVRDGCCGIFIIPSEETRTEKGS